MVYPAAQNNSRYFYYSETKRANLKARTTVTVAYQPAINPEDNSTQIKLRG
jgi:hypothetical protein